MTPLNPHRQPSVRFDSRSPDRYGKSYRFDGFERVIAATRPEEVLPALAAVEDAAAHGWHAAGFVSYEAASALNPALPELPLSELPLVWFALFRLRLDFQEEHSGTEEEPCALSSLRMDRTGEEYAAAVAAVREAIAGGETYQANFTARLSFSLTGSPERLYRRMLDRQQAPFNAMIDTGDHLILSASPELFFALAGRTVTMRPMKGTAPRSADPAEDLRLAEGLAASPKERAENLMIVDLVRNDLGTIAETGTVSVSSLFDVESYPTVHQMTSTVTATLRPGTTLTGIFHALFPCGSVTGAPKRRTMELIRELETTPRGIYCGAIGHVSPGGEAVFSVAIRTALLDPHGNGVMGIGSGVTWDSRADSEHRECLAKGAFLAGCSDRFSLIESLRHDESGYLLLERHLARLAASAACFGFLFDEPEIRRRLDEQAAALAGINKVRLQLEKDGTILLETVPIKEMTGVAPVALAECRISSADPFLCHKTTLRALYDQERSARPDFYDVIFRNERDEVTEGSYNSLVALIRGKLLTPALSCGLLPGVLRQELLDAGGVREAVLTVHDLVTSDRLWLINSVRGWRECVLQ